MSFQEKRRGGAGIANSSGTGSASGSAEAANRRSHNVSRPSPCPLLQPPSTCYLSTNPTHPSGVPLRRSHSSLNKFSCGVSSSSSSSPGSGGGGIMHSTGSQVCLSPHRYLDVPDAASMMTPHQSRTPSSASLLFGTMSSLPPAVSNNYRRLAGNIPGTASNFLKYNSTSPVLKRVHTGLPLLADKDAHRYTMPERKDSTALHKKDAVMRRTEQARVPRLTKNVHVHENYTNPCNKKSVWLMQMICKIFLYLSTFCCNGIFLGNHKKLE